jgi:hypothetical protein
VGLAAVGAEEIQPSPMRFAQLFVIDRLAYAGLPDLLENELKFTLLEEDCASLPPPTY